MLFSTEMDRSAPVYCHYHGKKLRNFYPLNEYSPLLFIWVSFLLFGLVLTTTFQLNSDFCCVAEKAIFCCDIICCYVNNIYCFYSVKMLFHLFSFHYYYPLCCTNISLCYTMLQKNKQKQEKRKKKGFSLLNNYGFKERIDRSFHDYYGCLLFFLNPHNDTSPLHPFSQSCSPSPLPIFPKLTMTQIIVLVTMWTHG